MQKMIGFVLLILAICCCNLVEVLFIEQWIAIPVTLYISLLSLFLSVLRHQKLHFFPLDLAYGRISRLFIKKNFTINMEITILRLNTVLIKYFLLRSIWVIFDFTEIISFFIDGLSSGFSLTYSKELWCLYRILQYDIINSFLLSFVLPFSKHFEIIFT